MKASELRLGNLVNWGVNIVPVKSIHTESVLKNEVRVYVELNKKLQNYCLDIIEIEPTPLTEEWLLKFGFERKPWGLIKGGLLFRDNIKNPCSELTLEVGNGFRVTVQYLHQLQNLYFALTGKELVVKE